MLFFSDILIERPTYYPRAISCGAGLISACVIFIGSLFKIYFRLVLHRASSAFYALCFGLLPTAPR